ncbi:MAG: flagellar filament capping protein FliD, partial [Gammaproteobacteria bacterium]
GAANSLEITVQDNDTNNIDASGLSLLAFNSTATNLQQTQAANDTSGLVINGIPISSASNTLPDTIEGLNISLKSVGSASLTVTLDKNNVSGAINNFVNSYNALINTINNLSSYNPETGEAGLLNGDGVLRSIDAQVRRMLTDPVKDLTGPYRLLADVGVTRNSKDGTLVLDNGKLNTALDENFDAIAGLFAAVGTTSDALVSYEGSQALTLTGNYDINVTQMASHGDITGSVAANLNIVAGSNDELTFSVDGIAATITLSAGSYASAGTLATEIQSRINGVEALNKAGFSVKVSESSGVLTIASNSYGATSKIVVSGGNAMTDLLGSAPIVSDGKDVAGTIGGVEASGEGQYLTGSGAAQGLKIKVAGGSTGDRGTISFSRGYAEMLDDMLGELLDSEGVFTSVTDGIQNRIDEIGAQRVVIDRRILAYEERIRRQFIAMDALVSQLRTTGSFLDQQLASLPTIGGGKK